MLREAALLLALVGWLPMDAMGQEAEDRVDEVLDAWRRHPARAEKKVGERLAAIGPAAIPYLGTLLVEEPERVPVAEIARCLGHHGGDRVVGPLSALLGSTERSHRESAVMALGSSRSAAALEPLVTALGDDHIRVRLGACPALVALVRAEAVEAPIELLSQAVKDHGHKDAFALALANLPGDEARQALYDLLTYAFDDDVALAAMGGLWEVPRPGDAAVVHPLVLDPRTLGVCKKASLLMGRLEYRPAVRDLIDLLYDADDGLVKNAHWSLRRITKLSVGPDPEAWEIWWERVGSRASFQ